MSFIWIFFFDLHLLNVNTLNAVKLVKSILNRCSTLLELIVFFLHQFIYNVYLYLYACLFRSIFDADKEFWLIFFPFFFCSTNGVIFKLAPHSISYVSFPNKVELACRRIEIEIRHSYCFKNEWKESVQFMNVKPFFWRFIRITNSCLWHWT